MASELSRAIATRMLVANAQGKFDQEYSSAMELIRPEIDAELQEAREVVKSLYNKQRQLSHPATRWELPEYERARALMERLKP